MSGTENTEVINIRGVSANNGITTLLIACGLLISGAVIIIALPHLFFLLGVLIVSASIIAFTMGYFKLKEPKFSLSITKKSLRYHHRRGVWEIEWDNIQRVGVPKIQRGLEHLDLEMVGIRLKDREQVIKRISPRLISYLLMEQRPLVTQIEHSQCETGRCYGDDLIADQRYKMKSGEELDGIAALFANRMKRLCEGLGYDLYISVNDLDRSADEFVNLLKDCQQNLN